MKGTHANVIFFEMVNEEWVRVENDAVGSEVVEIILDPIDKAKV